MALCRWSSMNWSCDLYIYEGCDGQWHTHVAGNRILGDVPRLDSPIPVNNAFTKEVINTWNEQYINQIKFLDSCERKPIGLKYDGQSFVDATTEDLLGRLFHLRHVGYNFPNFTEEDLE